ncbi:hypothetical protein EV356DRAFT_376446 [Viridothelium virens]|uniref:Uncharacterized protein n=1 Tax=Viridothelium virens TaxID=1048519 RepID=A0A6A6GVN5_VIRVR|nr:hypothetical protein EV356DRAFT_376446 [Viridothelium virens]
MFNMSDPLSPQGKETHGLGLNFHLTTDDWKASQGGDRRAFTSSIGAEAMGLGDLRPETLDENYESDDSTIRADRDGNSSIADSTTGSTQDPSLLLAEESGNDSQEHGTLRQLTNIHSLAGDHDSGESGSGESDSEEGDLEVPSCQSGSDDEMPPKSESDTVGNVQEARPHRKSKGKAAIKFDEELAQGNFSQQTRPRGRKGSVHRKDPESSPKRKSIKLMIKFSTETKINESTQNKPASAEENPPSVSTGPSLAVDKSPKMRSEESFNVDDYEIEPATEKPTRYANLHRLVDMFRFSSTTDDFARALKNHFTGDEFPVIVAPEKRFEEIMPRVSPEVLLEIFDASEDEEDFEDRVRNHHHGKNYMITMEDWEYDSGSSGSAELKRGRSVRGPTSVGRRGARRLREDQS